MTGGRNCIVVLVYIPTLMMVASAPGLAAYQCQKLQHCHQGCWAALWPLAHAAAPQHHCLSCPCPATPFHLVRYGGVPPACQKQHMNMQVRTGSSLLTWQCAVVC